MLSSKEFNHLQEMARRHAFERKKIEKFLIEIEDRKGPNSHLWLACKRNGDTAREGRVQLRKMRSAACRHMVADLACIGKSRDIRLVFFTRESIFSFNEVEMNDLNSIVNKAHIDENVKGGLRWPVGGMCSTSGRFNVVGLSHVVRTTLVGAGIKWSFEVCNRTEFKASWGRITYEVMLNACGFKDYFKANRDGSTDDLRQRIEKLLEQAWTDWL